MNIYQKCLTSKPVSMCWCRVVGGWGGWLNNTEFISPKEGGMGKKREKKTDGTATTKKD